MQSSRRPFGVAFFVLTGMDKMMPYKGEKLPERIWLVNADGVVDKKPAAQKLTSGQRHYMYRMGLLAVDEFMKQRGFNTNAAESSTAMSYEKSRGGRYVWIDLKIMPPENIAFVTSRPDYVYKQEEAGQAVDGQKLYRVNASVTTAKDILGCDLLIRVMVSANDAAGTYKPVFIPLPKDLEKPARYVLENVLGVLASACQKLPHINAAFHSDEIKTAAAKLDELPLRDQEASSSPFQ